MLKIANSNRNAAEAIVPTMPPKALRSSKRPLTSAAAKPIAIESSKTTGEWPSEKKNPTATGR